MPSFFLHLVRIHLHHIFTQALFSSFTSHIPNPVHNSTSVWTCSLTQLSAKPYQRKLFHYWDYQLSRWAVFRFIWLTARQLGKPLTILLAALFIFGNTRPNCSLHPRFSPHLCISMRLSPGMNSLNFLLLHLQVYIFYLHGFQLSVLGPVWGYSRSTWLVLKNTSTLIWPQPTEWKSLVLQMGEPVFV